MVDSDSFRSIRVVLSAMLFSPYFFFSDLVRLSYCSFSACSASPVPPCLVTVLSGYRPVRLPSCPVTVLSGLPVNVLSRHFLLPSCPFLTVLFLSVRSCLVNVQADLAQCLYHRVQPYVTVLLPSNPVLSPSFHLPSCPILTSCQLSSCTSLQLPVTYHCLQVTFLSRTVLSRPLQIPVLYRSVQFQS
jgi:hypothetical protein